MLVRNRSHTASDAQYVTVHPIAGLGPLAPEVLPQTLGVMAAVLPELALGGGHRPLGSGQEPAVAAGAGEQLTARAPVVWRPPLDAVAEGTKTSQAAQQLYPSRTGPWLALPNAFQPAQYRLLHRLLHQHVQLLTQVGCCQSGQCSKDRCIREG